MASFNYYLKDASAKDEQPVYLRYNDRGAINLKFYIGQKIKPKFWDSGDQVARRNFDGYADFNSILTERKGQLEQLCRQLQATDGKIDIEILKERFNGLLGRNEGKEKIDFKTLYDFAKHYIESVKSAKAANTILHNNQTLNLLKNFQDAKGKKITFDRVNLDFYNDFVEYLTKTKNYSPNTIGKHIANIKLFLNEATERGINTKFDFKSKRFKTTSEPVESIYLSEAELLKIYKHDFTNHKKLEHTRDLFIIGCFTGLRFSDFSQLKTENITDGQIKVKTQKTREMVVIPIHWTVKAILQKYAHTAKGLPRPFSNQKMNDYLKDVGEAVEINENVLHTHTKGGLKVQATTPKYNLMTTHTARRSFATNLFLSGFPAISIMKITGHKTEKSFMKYIRISQEENAKLLQLHWNKEVKLKAV
jgi:integrase